VPRDDRPLQLAEATLAKAGVTKFPVRVFDIARKYAYVTYETLPKDVSGMLVPKVGDAKKAWIIAINRAHSPLRQRFTIAHELGHILLHAFKTPHADGHLGVRFRDDTSSQGTNLEEMEANRFAAELLLPASLLVPRLRELGIEEWDADHTSSEIAERIASLADECKVSQQAMLIRVGSLLR